jgi:hypothetical protein
MEIHSAIAKLCLCSFSQYSKPAPASILSEVTTDRPCVAVATLHSKSPVDNYRYRMKDVDCKTSAPFICKLNPGVKSFLKTFRRRDFMPTRC